MQICHSEERSDEESCGRTHRSAPTEEREDGGGTVITLAPNPKQMEFFRARERFVAYGGARGGGKSWAIRQKARLLALYYGKSEICGGKILRAGGPQNDKTCHPEGLENPKDLPGDRRSPLQRDGEICGGKILRAGGPQNDKETHELQICHSEERSDEESCGRTHRSAPTEEREDARSPRNDREGQGIRILILRRTFPQLRENHIIPMKAELEGLAVWKETDKAFLFPNGSRIRFGYCDSENDVDQYQGQEYDIIFLDEATHFTEYQFSALTACLRGANSYPKRMYLTCNPGGVGHSWVKRLFVDRDFRPGEDPAHYRFIQAKASDNTVLLRHDPGYLNMLDNLPDGLREAWRDGRWDIFAGRYFPEFKPDTHVIAPRALPRRWPRFRAFDYGLDMLACYWCAIDPTGRVWVYRELCQSGLIVSEAAAAIRELTLPGEFIRYTVAPPDMWGTQKDTGRTMGELFALNGVPLVTASNRRVQGWMAVKEFLKLRPDGLPGLVVFDCCRNLIRDLQAIQHDEKNPNDAAVEPHEYTHTADAIRYLCAWRAAAEAEPEEEDEWEEDGVEYERFMLGN